MTPSPKQGIDWTDSISGLLMLTPLIIVSGAVYGMGWAVSISGKIAEDQQRNIFDIFSVTPSGALGTSWAIALSSMYYNQSFKRLNTSNTWFARLILLAPFLFILWISLAPSAASIFFLTAIYIDYFQSIVLGGLIGMVAPTYATNRLDSRLLAFGIYALLQSVVYVAFLMAVLFILPNTYRLFNLSGWLADWSSPLVAVTILYLIREGIILAVWYSLLGRLNALADIDAFLQGTL